MVLRPIVFALLLAAQDAFIALDSPAIRVTPSRNGKIKPGQLLVLTISGDAETVQCRLIGGGSDSYYVADGGKTVAFAAEKAGTFTFVIAGAKRADGAPLLNVVEHVVIVDGAAPSPGPDPGPPPPGPVIDPERDKLGLATVAYRAAQDCRAKYPECDVVAFARNFDSVASQIAAGVLATPEAMNAKLKELNRATGGAKIEAYGPALIAPIATATGAKKLATMAEHHAALTEIGYGMRRAVE